LPKHIIQISWGVFPRVHCVQRQDFTRLIYKLSSNRRFRPTNTRKLAVSADGWCKLTEGHKDTPT